MGAPSEGPVPDRPPGLSRRGFLRALGGAGALAAVSYLTVRGLAFDAGADRTGRPRGTPPPEADAPPSEADARLDELVRNIVNGGPPKDGIPAIDRPRFIPARDAFFLDDRDVVFGIVHAGEVRAYPQLVLVWHEIVNDRFPDGRLSVTYCPLTGSVVGFRGTAPDGRPYTFGTSGDLVNSNLLMYDRQTDNRWPQILGQALLDPLRGEPLEEVPLDWTTWGRWRSAHPDTVVLSTDTGYARAYGQDPYGSYTPPSGYYVSGYPFFPVIREDDRFPAKEVFVGVKLGPRLGDPRLAVRKSLLRERGAVAARMGDEPVVLLHDPALDEGRAYLARADARELRLGPGERPGEYREARTGSVFDALGRGIRGRLAGLALERVVSFDVMWFAWAAFYPETEVIG